MNDPFVLEQARNWAEKLIDSTSDRDERLELAFNEAFGRSPSQQEIDEARQFFEDHANSFESQEEKTNENELERQLWNDFCHVLFNMKEFIYIR